MSEEPLVPEWAELRRELDSVATAVGAENGYVLDAWCNLWCSAYEEDPEMRSGVIELVRDELDSLELPLPQGGWIDRRAHQYRGHAYLKSFGSVYVLVLRHAAPFDLTAQQKAVAEALETIEPLVVGLAPHPGLIPEVPTEPGSG